MKITRVIPIRAGQFLYVRIETDAGVHGIGEAGCWGALETAQAAITKFATYLEGRDPRPIEHHWNVLHRDAYYQGAAINGAISAIDIALWDIKGKALGVPVYELLGGPVRTRARTAINTTHCVDSTLARACVAWGRPAHGPSAVVCRYIEPRGHASRMRSMPPPAP
jgi:L-alanine-DL-glutamate epimerase-like enolase superfamily enzyme